MTSELAKRIFTSIALIGLFLFCFFIHPYFFYILITIVTIISWFELNNIFKKIKLNKNINIFLSFIYLSFFVFIVSYGYNQKISIIFVLH